MSPAVKLALGLAIAFGVGIVGLVPVLAGGADGQSAQVGASLATLLTIASDSCVVGGPVAGLTPAQAANAEQVVSAAFAASAENQQVARVALMVAWTESGLRNLGPLPNNQGSLGLFQQRGWGTPAQEMNPTAATGLFVHHLLAIRGWAHLPPWVAAQDVQRSAFANGDNYRASWPRSGQLLLEVLANGQSPGSCGQGVPAGVAGPASAHGLPVGYQIPKNTPPAHAAVVAWALRQLGHPYVWGAAGPGSYDCSGLTMAAWGTVGVSLLHYTVDQQHEGVPVSAGTLIAGDLVLIPGSDPPAPGEAGHVGIYLGDGLVESAIDPAEGVAVQPWRVFVSGGLLALRDPDPADG